MAIDLDFSDVGTPAFKRIAEGETTFTITEWDDKDSAKGKKMLTLTLEVVESPDPNSVGLSLRSFFVLETENLPYFKLFLQAVLGVDVDGPLSNFINEWDELLGLKVGGNVMHTVDKNDANKVFANVNSYSWYSV